jgi:hypothetical protein
MSSNPHFSTREYFLRFLTEDIPRLDEYRLLNRVVMASGESNDGVIFFAYDQGFTTVLSYCDEILKNSRTYCLATAIGFCFHQKEFLDWKP